MHVTFKRLAWMGTLVCGLASGSQAQELPSVSMHHGDLVSPSAAYSYYDGYGTTHTKGVYADGSQFWAQRPVEITEIARGLGSEDVQSGSMTADAYALKAYNYVRNNIAVEFRYGLAKGALGALIDQSGTPFDQAQLMVELVRAAGVTATYKVGTITLNETQFGEWTGLVYDLISSNGTQTFKVSAKEACRFLADGGIPAAFGGSSPAACNLTGRLSTVDVGHIWVVANGKAYDPAYKVNTLIQGQNLATIMQCGTGCGDAAISAAMTGATYQRDNLVNADTVVNLNETKLEAKLDNFATTLQIFIQNQNAASAGSLQVGDIVGGQKIFVTEVQAAVDAVPVASSEYLTWLGDVPNGYRSKLRVRFGQLDQTLFADEIYGGRLEIVGNRNGGKLTLLLEKKPVVANKTWNTTDNKMVTLNIDHPYSAASGTYMDDQVTAGPLVNHVPLASGNQDLGKDVFSPALVIHGWGDTGTYNTVRYSKLLRAAYGGGGAPDPTLGLLASSWLSQVTQAGRLVDAISESQHHHHHTLGLAQNYACTTGFDDSADIIVDVQGSNGVGDLSKETACVWQYIDAETRLSVIGRSDSIQERAAQFVHASVLDTLEGGTLRQQFDQFTDRSSLALFQLANQQARKFYLVDSSNVNTFFSGVSQTGFAGAQAYTNPEKVAIKNYLYANSGRKMLLPLIGDIGEFSFGFVSGGSNATSTIYIDDAPLMGFTSDGASISYLGKGLIDDEGFKKGSAIGLPDDPLGAVLDAEKSLQRERNTLFNVNQASGGIDLAPTPDLIEGQGPFPYSLPFQRFFSSDRATAKTNYGLKDGPYGTTNAIATTIRTEMSGMPDGWTHKYYIRANISSNAARGMGEESALDASGFLARLYVLHDLAGKSLTANGDIKTLMSLVFTAHSTGRLLEGNAVNVDLPPQSLAFLRLPDGSFNPQVGQQARLVQSEARQQLYQGGFNFGYVYSGVQFALTLGDGSQMSLQRAGFIVHGSNKVRVT